MALDAVVANVTSAAAARLRRVPGVASVTPDAEVRLSGEIWLADDGGTPAMTVAEVGDLIGVPRLPLAGRAPAPGVYTGKGVDVALIDSGVVPVKGLGTTGKIVNGADVSFDSPSPSLRHLDGYGHGTHMAGIIAGRDAGADGAPLTNPERSSGSRRMPGS